MKIIIQIPCYNEEYQLPTTIYEIKSAISNFSFSGSENINWEIMIIDDGSTDKTLKVASKLNVEHIVSLGRHRGLAYTFQKGIDKCLSLGASIIINTDADNQYQSKDIEKLIIPILENKADMVIGDRQILKSDEFSSIKKKLHFIGSYVVRKISNTNVKDVPSGFRSFNRYAAKKINITAKYTYTLENIIQSSFYGIKITTVPIRVNKSTRKSRLIKSNSQYITASVLTIVRLILKYRFIILKRIYKKFILTLILFSLILLIIKFIIL